MSAEPDSTSNGRRLPIRGNYSPAEPERVDVLHLLDELEALPKKALHIARVKTLIGFDREQFDYLVLKIRANLPDDVRKAQTVVRDSERIFDEARTKAHNAIESGRTEAQVVLESAQVDANRIIEHARAQAAHMVEQTEVHRIAAAQAQEMLKAAEQDAMVTRKGADDYAHAVLDHIDRVLGKLSGAVQDSRGMLDKVRP